MGIGGVEGQCLGAIVDGAVKVSKGGLDFTTVGISLDKAWTETNSFVGVRQRTRQVPHAPLDLPAIVEGGCECGHAINRDGDILQGASEVSEFHLGHTAVAVGCGVVWFERDERA